MNFSIKTAYIKTSHSSNIFKWDLSGREKCDELTPFYSRLYLRVPENFDVET